MYKSLNSHPAVHDKTDFRLKNQSHNYRINSSYIWIFSNSRFKTMIVLEKS